MKRNNGKLCKNEYLYPNILGPSDVSIIMSAVLSVQSWNTLLLLLLFHAFLRS